MTDISIKYSLLDKTSKQEINDFIDFLLSKKSAHKEIPLTDYKKKILTVSTWSDEEIKVFKDNENLFNQWSIEKW